MILFGMEIPPFMLGAGGALFTEMALVALEYNKNEELPQRYKSILYLIVRAVLALGGGVLVVAHDITQPLAAMHIGASAPVFFAALPKKSPQGGDHG